MMTIYDLNKEVPNWVGQFDISDSEVERILSQSETLEDFTNTWENEDWWTDTTNSEGYSDD